MVNASAKVVLEKGTGSINNIPFDFNGTRIIIECTKFEEDDGNQPITVAIPNVSATVQDNNGPNTKTKDLKRITVVYTIEGYLYAQNTYVKSATPELITATQAKAILKYYLLYSSGQLKMYWRGLEKAQTSTQPYLPVVKPSTALVDMFESVDTNRYAYVIYKQSKFGDDPGLNADFKYNISDGYDFDEFNCKRYRVTLSFTRGVSF